MDNESPGLFKPFSKLDEFLFIFLKSYFENHPEFPWSEKDPKIIIKAPFTLDSEDNEVYPKIIIESGPFSMTNYGFLTEFQGDGMNKTLADFTQERSKKYNIGCVYFLNIMTRNPRQARSIAQELAVMFSMYIDRINEHFNIIIQKNFDLSPEVSEFEGRNFSVSKVRMNLVTSYTYTLSTKFLPIYPKLADIDLLTEVGKKLNDLDISKLKFTK